MIQYSTSTDVNSSAICWMHLCISSDYFDFFPFFYSGSQNAQVLHQHGKLAQMGVVNILQPHGATLSHPDIYTWMFI